MIQVFQIDVPLDHPYLGSCIAPPAPVPQSVTSRTNDNINTIPVTEALGLPYDFTAVDYPGFRATNRSVVWPDDPAPQDPAFFRAWLQPEWFQHNGGSADDAWCFMILRKDLGPLTLGDGQLLHDFLWQAYKRCKQADQDTRTHGRRQDARKRDRLRQHLQRKWHKVMDQFKAKCTGTEHSDAVRYWRKMDRALCPKGYKRFLEKNRRKDAASRVKTNPGAGGEDAGAGSGAGSGANKEVPIDDLGGSNANNDNTQQKTTGAAGAAGSGTQRRASTDKVKGFLEKLRCRVA